MKVVKRAAVGGKVLLLTAVMCLYLFPVYLILINSLKPFPDIFQSFVAFPKGLYLDNYRKAFHNSDFFRLLFNNLLLTGAAVIGIIFTTSLAGYKLSRVKSKLSTFFYFLFTVPFLIPFYTYMIPLLQLIQKTGLMNSLLGLAMVYVSTSSFSFFMFHGFVKGIPTELDEAARIDGCTEFQTYWKIILPLLKPVVSSVAVLNSIWIWNDFLLPFLTLSAKNKHTITISVYQLFGKYGSDWDVVTATLVLATLPVVILYIFLQRYIISGVVAGSVKG